MSSPPSTPTRKPAPAISLASAERISIEAFGHPGRAQPLDSYIDCNFLITGMDGKRAVLKIANEAESREEFELQASMLKCLAERLPGIAPTQCAELVEVEGDDGRLHIARLATFLEGDLFADHHAAANNETHRGLGELLARVDLALADLRHPTQARSLRWNLCSALDLVSKPSPLWNSEQIDLALATATQFAAHVAPRISDLPSQLIHNDANEFNLVARRNKGMPEVSGIFDFGDAVWAPRIFELAVAGAYAAIGNSPNDPLEALTRVAEMAAGYDQVLPLADEELEVLFPAMLMRLALSVTISSMDAEFEEDNDYINVNQAPAWAGLKCLLAVHPKEAVILFRKYLGRPGTPAACSAVNPEMSKEDILEQRRRHTGRSLSISYSDPLTILKGRGAWLFDQNDRGYLDGVNNVCHVGHCHPKVVAAATQQISALNTNTRYLHPNMARYAQRLAALFPDPLAVCFFVNSGSEANELALRLARAATGRRNVITMEGGYHGNTGGLIELSHYKHAGPGGSGAPDWVRTVPCPDVYRGMHRGVDAAMQYAAHMNEAVADFEPAAFMFEPLIGCGGQIVPPHGYLTEACKIARAAGALVIADEVQVGFGRVGTHWWAHQLDDDAGGTHPDIVTLGKPIGNGHPMAAVITTQAIADAFANGMEYFNTFGGNPVSCAIGLAVLDVIEKQDLLNNAQRIGAHLRSGIERLAVQFPVIGDVRGVGLYIGAEFVSDPDSKTPDAQRLTAVLDHCKQAGVLFSSDGPDHNVLKIKPPIIWTVAEADLALAILQQALSRTQ